MERDEVEKGTLETSLSKEGGLPKNQKTSQLKVEAQSVHITSPPCSIFSQEVSHHLFS